MLFKSPRERSPHKRLLPTSTRRAFVSYGLVLARVRVLSEQGLASCPRAKKKSWQNSFVRSSVTLDQFLDAAGLDSRGVFLSHNGDFNQYPVS
jgi:hypothetical protein